MDKKKKRNMGKQFGETNMLEILGRRNSFKLRDLSKDIWYGTMMTQQNIGSI
jgi:hypothetical protein